MTQAKTGVGGNVTLDSLFMQPFFICSYSHMYLTAYLLSSDLCVTYSNILQPLLIITRDILLRRVFPDVWC
jgi:hypothetical protein